MIACTCSNVCVGGQKTLRLKYCLFSECHLPRMPMKAVTEGKSETLPQQGGGGGDKTLAPKQPKGANMEDKLKR